MDPLQFVETPVASAFFTASVTNTFDGVGVGTADDWTLEAEAGDRLTARIEATVVNSRPRLRLLNPASQIIASLDGDTSGTADFYNVLLPAPGTYRVRVYTDQQTSAYRLRVDLARGPSLEIEPNNTNANANLPDPTLLAGSFRFRVAATLTAAETAGDFFGLGVLDTGNNLASELFTGPQSALQSGNTVVSLFRLGSPAAVFSANTNFNFTVTQRDVYFVRVTSDLNRDLFARYFLTLTVTDNVPPSIQSVSLPAEGTTSTEIINSFTVVFSELMTPASVNNLANYNLRNAGPDTTFGTSDDQIFPLLSPGYTGGTNATFALANGPLQPGGYRLIIAAAVTDRAGNPLTPALTRNFTIERLGAFVFESRTNDTPAAATSLSLAAVNTPDGSFGVRNSYSAGNNPYFVLPGFFNGDAHLDLAVANFSSDSVSIFRGNGDATFLPATNFPAANAPIALAAGDLNGDSFTDLVVANYNGSSVSVLAGRGDATFHAPTNYPVGSNPRSVKLGDFNGDGRLDLVTANAGSGNLTLRLGNPAAPGTFQAAVNITTGGGAHGVTLGHFNGDGFLDIAVANPTPDTLSVLLGNGNGTFAAPVNHSVGAGPRSVTLADFNGDTALDAAVINSGNNTVSVLFGDGSGNLGAAVTYAAGTSDPYHVIAGDWNADGRPDLAIASYGSSRLTVMLNNGLGGFAAGANHVVSGNPIAVAAGDFDSDGRLDLATANYHGNSLTILRPNPSQLLAEDPAGSGFRTGAGRGNLSSGSDADYWSFTGYAGQRLVVASETPGHAGSSGLQYLVERPDGSTLVNFASNNGTGQSAPVTLPFSGTYVVRVQQYHAYYGEYRLRVTLAPPPWQLEGEDNNAVGQANVFTFTRTPTNQWAKIMGYVRFADPGDVFALAYAPLGRAEQVFLLPAGTQIRLSLARPASSLLQPILEVLNSAGTVVASESPGNTNLTHTLPAGPTARYYVRVRAGSGTDGLFAQYLLNVELTIPPDVTPPQIVSDTLPTQGTTNGSVIDRFTLNFSEELSPATVNNAAAYQLRHAGLDTVLGNGDDIFYAVVSSPTYANGSNASYFVTDGPLQSGSYRLIVQTTLQDLSLNPLAAQYVRNFTLTNITGFVFESRTNDTPAGATSLSLAAVNTPDGSFGVRNSYTAANNPYFVVAGHFNGDAHLDLAVANFGSDNVSIFRGNGDATFLPATNFPAANAPIALAAGDLNGDSFTDLVVANYSGNSVSVLAGRGDATFHAPTNYPVGSNPRSVKLGDFNGDGRLDLVTANAGSGNLTLRLGNPAAPGTFQAAVNITTGGGAHGVAVGHFNGDGFLDIAVVNPTPDTLSILLGNGNGTFAAPVNHNVGSDPRSVALADFNGDTALDAVVINPGNNTVSVLFGDGSGNLGAAVTYAAGTSDPYHVIAGDWNADGRPDLAIANYGSSRLTVMLNNGLGGFEAGANHIVSGNPIAVAAGDFDSDGRLDLATANYQGNSLTILRPNPSQLLAEDPAGSGFRTGSGRGNLSSGSDADYWSFTAQAGQRLVVASETPGHAGSSGLQYIVERPDGSTLVSFVSNNGTGQSAPLTLPFSGTYVVRVQQYHAYYGEYRLRVTLAPPPWQLETEDNNSVGQADVPTFTREATNQWAKILGYVRFADPGDVFRLRNLPPNSETPLPDLPAGTEIRLWYDRPNTSSLVGILEVLNASGSVLAAGAAGTTNLVYTVPTEASYYVRIRGSGGTEGLFSQYLLNVLILVPQDVVPPEIVVNTLPAEGTMVAPIVDRFDLSFSEDMLAATVTSSANYELRGAGADSLFNTSDDALYTVANSPAYVIGTNASYLITNGPLQPGAYRFTAGTSLQDSSGNALVQAHVRNFSITNVSGFVFESRTNGTPAGATSLSLAAVNTPDGSFGVRNSYSAGNNPYFVLPGFFNGDAHLDLAVANFSSDSVSIFRGNGDATFLPATNFPAANGSIALAAGDLNGDSFTDLVVANYSGNSVSVLAGRGDATFHAPTNYPVGSNPRSVKLGDFNGDGRLDLVTANAGSGNLTLRLGNPAAPGTFQAAVNITTGGGAHGVTLGHFNGDGFLDIAVANPTPDTLSVLLGNGNGTFAAPVNHSVGAGPRSVTLADFNGDTALDAAVINSGNNTVSVLFGDGSGNLGAAVTYAAGTSDPYHVIAGDWNADGRPDLAIANYGSSRLTVMLNNGLGGFEAGANHIVSGNPIAVAAGDFDSDGRLDLATANYYGNTVTILRPNPSQLLAEDPAGSGFRTGAGRGNLSSGSDADYWSFTGYAGQRLVVASETPGHLGSSGLQYIVERPDGSTLVNFVSNNGTGQSAPLTLPFSGTYVVRVQQYHAYYGEYRLRVTLAPPPWQLEGEDNNAVGQANVPTLASVGVSQQASVLGYIRFGDPGDVFSLGNLSPGTDVRLTYGKPVSSGISGVLNVLNSSGNVVASAAAGTTNLTFTIPGGAAGSYYARIQAGEAGYATARETALFFDGGNDYVDVGTWTPGPQWTVEAWVRPTSLPGGRRNIAGGLAECLDWGITMENGRFGIAIKPPGTCSQTITAPNTVALGNWYHVVGTSDGLTARLYVNGQFVVSGAVQGNYIGTATGVRIGSETCCGGNTFPGYIDEVAIWNRALTGAEIAARLAGPLAGGESGLAGYWRFNEGQGGTTADASTQGRNGTLQNGVTWSSIAPASAAEPGLMTQYLLTMELTDLSPPTILADTLPAEGNAITSLFDRFTLDFSEDLLATTVNNTNTYDLRAKGADNQFDTVDDVLWPLAISPAYSSGLSANYFVPSALQPGDYRFTVKTNLQDRAGNGLAAAYVRSFTVAQITGFAIEIESNDTRETATPLGMASTQPDLISGAGRGYLRDGNDADFWSFQAQAGDKLVLAAQIPGNPANSGLQYLLYNPAGTQLASVNADNNGLLQMAPLTLTTNGTFTVRVTPWHGYYNEYRLRASLYRNGLAVESELNNTLGTANALSYATNGNTRSSVIGGYAQLSSDLDYFHLGVIEAGKTVFLGTRQPASSPLIPVVSVYNAANTYQAEAGSGRPSDGVAEVRIEQTGSYYALVRSTSGSDGLMSEYLMDVLVLPTADVIFPNLQVTALNVPVTAGLESGDPFTFDFKVENVGSLVTQVGLWFDRVVLSADPVMDDTDLVLGLFQHSGALSPAQSYGVTNTVNLPDGISGSFYVIAKADYTDTVNEFVLEGDNETATANPLTITLANYPNLVVENLNLTGPNASQVYTLAWNTFNRGTAATAAGFAERVRVRNQTTATTIFDQTYTNAGSLAINASVPRQVNFSATTPGTYLVEVITDSAQAVFEYDAVSHQSAENNTFTTNFAITAFFTLTLNAIPPTAGILIGAGTYPQGTGVNVTATPITNQSPYYFVHWAEGNVVRSANSNYTFSLNQNLNLTAVFALPSYEITASNHPPAAGTVAGTGFYIWGTTNTLTAQPAFGYKFSHWTDGSAIVGSNVTLVTVVSSNRFVVANYANAHLVHQVTTATLPAGLATVTGTGTYNNGQNTTISAPAAVTNAPPNYYAFKRFTLNGAAYGTSASFLETFATTDPTNMHFVAEYDLVDATPPAITAISNLPGVTSAVVTWTTSEPATSRVEYGLTTSYTVTNSSAVLRTQHSLMLAGLTPATLYHFRVRSTDANGNQTVSGDFTFTTLTPPDLTLGAVATQAAAQAGTVVPLTFVITNIGPGTATGPWQNAVLYADNANGIGAQTLGAVTFNPAGGIAPGTSHTVTQNVIVPSIGIGPRYFGVRVDSASQVFELNENNNTAFAAAPLNIVAVDLRVARVTAPATATFGATVPVEIVVTNAGSAAATFPWLDLIYLSTASNALTTLLTTLDAPVVPLAPGASYTNQTTVTLPLEAGSTPGVYYLVAAADQGTAIQESDENNNLRAQALTLSLPPLPDLGIRNILSPSNASPGQTLSLVWTVTNLGSLTITGAWSETIYLATNGAGVGAQEIATLDFTNSLIPGGTLTRTQSVTIPTASVLGNLWFAVQADSRNEFVEVSEANNLGVASHATLIPAVLSLQLANSQIAEGASQPIVATVTRNGSRAAPLTVTLNNSDPTEISMPGQVIILAGQASVSFNVLALADGVPDGPQIVTIGALAPGFDPGSANLTVLDVNLPTLTITPATNNVIEGQAVTAVLSRNAGAGQAITVTVGSSSTTQLLPPGPVTIPAGQLAVEISFLALDDSLVESPITVNATASANGYLGASAPVTILDDDWPVLTFTLAPGTISENAGPQAAQARLVSAPLSSRAIEFELESSNPNALRVPPLVTMPAGETNIAFPVAAVDNALVDGNKPVTVRVWVRATGLTTRLGEGPPAAIVVTDNDGPTLSVTLSRQLVAEGQSPAATGTVTRNTTTNSALQVTLASSDLNELTVPPVITIPAGATSAPFNAASLNDNVTDGNKQVTVTASAVGFTSGNAPLTVTDVNLPDMVVASLTAPAVADTESFINVGFDILNQGLVASPSNAIVQRVYLSTDPLVGDDVLIGQLSVSATLPANSQFGQSFPVRLPQTAGNYWVIVETDALNNILENDENNNVRISTAPTQVVPAYAATVSTTLAASPAGTLVPLTGRAMRPVGGQPVPFALVSIHINVRGTTRTIAALTDAAGNFATSWQPLVGEAGFYEIAAAHPGSPIPSAQDSFSLLGMKAQPASPSVRLSEGSSIGGAVEIQNLSDVPLTGLAVQALNVPANVNATVTLQTNYLGGSAVIQLSYGISALNATFTSGAIVARITSAEGAVLDVHIRVTIDALVPRLVAFPGRLDGGMKRGVQRLVSFQIVNTGGLETGPLTVSLPPIPWMSLASENPMPSLNPGATNTVTLLLNPPEDMTLAQHQGNLAINGAGTGVAVPFTFRALSEASGALVISSVNEFTYYATGAPPLTNATVRVRDAVTRAVVTNGVTDATGRFRVPELMEGYYELELDAEQHNGHRSTIFLEPGITNEVTAFLSYQAVRYTWTVERIEIEDRYKITIETEFEAVVPAPVVTIEPAVLDVGDLLIVGQTKQVNMTFRNHGLIAADDVRLRFDSHPFYSIEPLISDLGRLAAKSSLTIPVTLRRIGDFGTIGGRVSAASGVPCGMGGGAAWTFECGPLKVGGGGPVAVSGVAGNCGGGGPGGGGPGGGGFGPGWGGGGSGPGNGGVNSSYSSPSIGIKVGCDAACWILAAAGCIPGPIGCFFAGFSCSVGFAGGVTVGSSVDCAINIAGCLIPLASIPSCIYSLAQCYFASGARVSPELAMAGAGDDAVAYYGQGVRAALNVFNELTGAPDGVWISPAVDTATGDWFSRFQGAASELSDGGRPITAAERAALLSGTQPTGIPAAEITRFLDRWNRTLSNAALGILRPADAPPGANLDFMDTIALKAKITLLGVYQEQAVAAGFTDPVNAIVETIRIRSQASEGGESGGVCARVKIKLDQEAVLSREAFRATLEIDNATANALENIRVTVRVTDGLGHDANEMFGLRPPELTGLSDVSGGGSVAGGAKGTARWTLIPTVDAAPLEPTQYFVGGEFRYTLNGAQVTVPLSPVPITVNPTARLTLDYFHQRDVFSDDPFTDLIEPSIPFNLAIMVRNNGAGEAKNFRITSAQPEIVENEKGLLIDFKIIATEVAGQNLTPTLTANFGTIPPGSISVGRWLMTSTLQGLFINYSATFEHLDGMGNPKLSLIDEVRIHEMNRLVQAGGTFQDGKPDFLVNNRPDVFDRPDTLWLSDGSSNAVEVVTNAVITGTLSPGNLQVQLTTSMPGGWVYLRVPDPANGQYRLVSVTRSDSVAIGIENVWVTDRTFIGMGKRPKRENILHLLDHNSTGQYTLTFAPLEATDAQPPASSVTALPPESRSLFLLNWSGQDNAGGSGLANFDVYFNENGGQFQRWLTATPTTSGVFQGTVGKTYAFYSVAVDQAGNREPAPAAPQAQTAVTMSNRPPAFTAIGTQAIVESQTFSLTAAAIDPDNDAVTYQFGAVTPPGLVLNAQSGLMTWLTGEAHGPGTNNIILIARDSGFPQLTATQTFLVIVIETNSPPTLPPITNYTIAENSLLTFTNVVSDLDLPAQKLAFRLANAPAGATINPTNGVFTWRPNETQGGVTNLISVIVTDNGPATLSATQTFIVRVLDTQPDFTLGIGSTAVWSNGVGSVALSLRSGIDLNELQLQLAVSGNRLTNLNLSGLASQLASANLLPLGSDRYNLNFTKQPGALLQGNLTLGQLGFTVISNEHSAVALLQGVGLEGVRTDSSLSVTGKAGFGRVFIVGREPILDAAPASGGQLALTLYGHPGRQYALEHTFGFGGTNAWSFDSLTTATDLRTELAARLLTRPAEYFRAVRGAALVALSIRLENGQVVIEWPLECAGCVLWQSPATSGPGVVWTQNTVQPQVVNGRYRVALPLEPTQRFYRLAVP